MKRAPTPDIMTDVLGPARPQPAKIKLSAIRTDGGTQMRACLDEATVAEYHGVMSDAQGWGPFPAVRIVHDGQDHWLGDGFHRVAAFRRLLDEQPDLATELPADIRAGTRRDAVLHAAGANASHGLRRSQADKRRSVETLLRDDEWRDWADREIARRCNVSADLVATVRRQMYPPAVPAVTVVSDSEPAPAEPATRTFVTKHGTPATMNTANIGKAQPTYAAVWAIERRVSAILERQTPIAEATAAHAADLRTAASTPGSALMREVEASLDEASLEFRRHDLVQAMHNVASQIEQELRRRATPTVAIPIKPASMTIAQLIEKIHACVPQFYTEPHEQVAAHQDIMTCAVTYSGGFWKFCNTEIADIPADHMRQAMQIVSGEIAERQRRAFMAENGRRSEEHFARLKAELEAARRNAEADETNILTPVAPVSQRADYDSDEWYTPEEIVRTAAGVMTRIDTDPASCELAQTVVQAGTYYTKFDDGLKQEWHGNIWLNPPYSSPQQWIDKLFAELAAGHTKQAIVLVNNATETAWFQRLLAEAKLACFPARRLAFWRHDHSDVGARQGQVICYFGSRAEVFHSAFSATGIIMRRLK